MRATGRRIRNIALLIDPHPLYLHNSDHADRTTGTLAIGKISGNPSLPLWPNGRRRVGAATGGQRRGGALLVSMPSGSRFTAALEPWGLEPEGCTVFVALRSEPCVRRTGGAAAGTSVAKDSAGRSAIAQSNPGHCASQAPGRQAGSNRRSDSRVSSRRELERNRAGDRAQRSLRNVPPALPRRTRGLRDEGSQQDVGSCSPLTPE